MKAIKFRSWTVLCVSALITAAGFRASADQATATTVHQPEKSYAGTIAAVDQASHTIRVEGWLFSKSFNLGNNCQYQFLDNGSGAASDLRPGQKVKVSYQDARGVLIANRIEQQPMRFEGTVKTITPDGKVLTIHRRGIDKTFQLPGDCKVTLRDDKSGTLADMQPGYYVTVTYETPNHTPTARNIAQTDASFTGKLTAIDLTDRTVKAKGLFGSKTFHLADGCAIVLNGKPDAEMRELKPGDKLEFSYEDVNGVSVADRIAYAGSKETLTATSR